MRTRILGIAALLVVGVLSLLAAPATAVPITFIHTGSGSGTLNGVPFNTSDFVITSLADTSNRQSFGSGFFIDHNNSSIVINGVGALTVLTPTRTFNNQNPGIVGYSRAGVNGNDLYNGPTDASLATWDMLSSFGPLAGSGSLLQWSLSPQINTSGGVLIFNNETGIPATFQAIIPEPSTLALAALAIVPALRRRRR